VRNILDFPCCFSLPAKVIALEHNYRSTQPILDAANAVIAQTAEQIAKTLYSTKASAERPFLATVEDEAAQAPVCRRQRARPPRGRHRAAPAGGAVPHGAS
jgi:DNA helicase II / ATP-dependent DNA helicase PcrA